MNNQKSIELKMIFMGTGDFAGSILEKLWKEKYNIVAVFTKPESNISRENLVNNPVRNFSKEKGLAMHEPEKLNDEIIQKIQELKPDIIIVASYGKIMPKSILDIPGFGCINIHASLLPKFRGPSPIQNTLLLGEKKTGITIMLMDQGIDTGDILNQKEIDIEDGDMKESLTKKLAIVGSDLLCEALPLWIKRKISAQPQDNDSATVCQLIDREDGRIFWEEEAETIYNKFRALTPWPGIFCFWENPKSKAAVRVKLHRIQLLRDQQKTERLPGEVFYTEDKSIAVQSLAGIIILEEIQIEGKKTVSSNEFVNGYPDFIGSVLK